VCFVCVVIAFWSRACEYLAAQGVGLKCVRGYLTAQRWFVSMTFMSVSRHLSLGNFRIYGPTDGLAFPSPVLTFCDRVRRLLRANSDLWIVDARLCRVSCYQNLGRKVRHVVFSCVSGVFCAQMLGSLPGPSYLVDGVIEASCLVFFAGSKT